MGQFAYWSFRLRDISPTGQFAYWTLHLLIFSLRDISPTAWSVRLQIAYFAYKTARIKSDVLHNICFTLQSHKH